MGRETTDVVPTLADQLRILGDDQELLFVVKEADGSDSQVIRFGPEVGVRIALRAIADHLEGADRG